MVDTHKSREVMPSEWMAVHSMHNTHGYKQVLALKIRIHSRVVAKEAPEDIFIVKSIGMDGGGDIVYYDNKQRPYFEEELEVVT